MEIVQCFQGFNWQCIQSWSIEQILGLLIFTVILGWIVSRTKNLILGIYLGCRLFKKNRGQIGRGYGTHAADVFIKIWYTPRSYNDKFKEHLGNSSVEFLLGGIAEECLVRSGLAEVYVDSDKKIRMVKVPNTFRCKSAFAIVWLGFKFKYGEEPSLYR